MIYFLVGLSIVTGVNSYFIYLDRKETKVIMKALKKRYLI
jgi:hypothetical protein